VRTGGRGRGRNLSCEWVVVAEVGDGGLVVRTAKYSETECPCRRGRQVLGSGGIVSYGPPSSRTVGRTPLFDDCHVVGPGPGPRQLYLSANHVELLEAHSLCQCRTI
jgi:hypothetical protein